MHRDEMTLALPRLNGLRPTVEGTFKKLVEEQGELAGALLVWRRQPDRERTGEVVAELLDVAQTCTSLMFAFEDTHRFPLDRLLDPYIENLAKAGHRADMGDLVFRRTEDGGRYLRLPALEIPDLSPERIVLSIAELTGRFARWTGKFRGASGEAEVRPMDEVIREAGLCLLQIAQGCFTLLYWFRDQEGVVVQEALERHLRKLKQKGYCA
ncbi:MAG: hypothetical protein QJR01_01465 [Kyrpidia sp.]|nr:hypothetical protein [Kyrpidia sp.]